MTDLGSNEIMPQIEGLVGSSPERLKIKTVRATVIGNNEFAIRR
jgi:hypothetical protein